MPERKRGARVGMTSPPTHREQVRDSPSSDQESGLGLIPNLKEPGGPCHTHRDAAPYQS